MKVLIFTASPGNGHNSVAKRITEYFKSDSEKHEILTIDMYKKYASRLVSWAMEDGYFLMCNHFMGIYNYFLKKAEESDIAKYDKVKANDNTFNYLNGMLKDIFEFKPDLIVCTYVLTAVAMTNIKRAYNIPAKVACMTLDYGVSPYWECTAKGLDYMFLTDEYMIDKFIERGFKRENLYVVGTPISPDFYVERDKLATREKLGLDKDLFTIVLMKASFFPYSDKKIVSEIAKIDKPVQIVIINGKSEKSKNRIDKYLSKLKLKHKIFNLGFVNNIPEYFSSCDLVVGKAGGLTSAETIAAGLPSLIVEKLPQQEIRNGEYLVNHGCSMFINKNTMAEKINLVLNDNALYQKMKESVKNVQSFDAIGKMFNVLKGVPKAEYKDDYFCETKHETVKKVRKQRKIDVKNNK